MKYIIKSCPAIYGDKYCKENTYEDGSIHCQDCTDCILKQIVEKCKENQKLIMEWNENGKIFSKYGESKKLADEILGLLEIEVIEE